MERVRYKKSNSRLNIGEQQYQKQISLPKISSNSSSSIIASAVEDSITFKSERSSLKFVSGTPIKKLLAEEMTKENEAKRRQPGLIARLMGLDGLPPQHSLQRQDKHCLGTLKQRSASMDLETKTKPHVRLSNRRTTSLGEQEFRDVYEIPETIKFEKHGYPVRKIVHSKEEMACSKNFPHKDQFTKIQQQPGSLCYSHFHDMQDATPSAQCTCIAVKKPQKSAIRKSNNIGCKAERKGLSVDAKCRRHQYDSSSSLSESNVHGAKKWPKPSKTRLEALRETTSLPTKIVLLKPNLEQMKATNKSVSSPASPRGSFSKSRSEDSREIAKVITRRMRKCFHRNPVDLSSILMGYAGDESSYNLSESDSASESEVTILTSRQSPLSSRRVQSSVNREAKKRLTERWKMSQRRKGIEVSGEGNTLGAMLHIPSRDTKTLLSDTSSYRDDREWSSPLGISSMDGWRGVNIQSRSKELRERKVHRREGSSSRNLRSNCKKFQPSQRICNSSSDSSDLECFYEPQLVVNEEGTSCSLDASNFIPGLDEEGVLMDIIIESLELTSVEFPAKTSTGVERSCSPTLDRQTSKAQNLQVDQLEEDSNLLTCPPIPEPQSPVSSKEADQPSPVSVLEAPFTEDPPSSPNCFESVSAGLQELKMQLKLLKMESGKECAENIDSTTIIISEDENMPSSYLADVLTDFCISPIWYSPDCPLGNCLFEKLENKYCNNNTTWPRCERMLLFDRINICLFDMFQTLEDDDSYPTRKVMELKHKVEEELQNEEKRIDEEITERMVDQEMQWPDFRESVEFIGKDLEKLLLNDLIENAAFKMLEE